MILVFFVLYICSFFWFKKTPWKRWALWTLVIFLSGIGGRTPEAQDFAWGQLIGLLILCQAIRWIFILCVNGINSVSRKGDNPKWDKTTIYDERSKKDQPNDPKP
jgi:hypothetical protein